jgi:hypothetical protein
MLSTFGMVMALYNLCQPNQLPNENQHEFLVLQIKTLFKTQYSNFNGYFWEVIDYIW